MKILIVKLSAIGDVIHTLPALNAIRRKYPHAHLTWLVEEAAADLIKGHPALDRVLVSRRKHWLKGLGGPAWRENVRAIKEFIRRLRDSEYDIVLDFQALFKSGLMVGLVHGKRKIGFARGMDHMEFSYLFYNERVPPVNMDIHALIRGVKLIESIGVNAKEIEYRIPVSPRDHGAVEDLLVRSGIAAKDAFVAINPVAKWHTKLWSEARFAELARQIMLDLQTKVVFTGAAADRAAIDRIVAQVNAEAVNLAGETTLKMLAALYERAHCVISTDTGPMHVAAAMGVPLVALFGPTAPWRTGPFGAGHHIVRAGVDCSPCFKRRCELLDCMLQINVADVFQQVKTAMRQTHNHAQSTGGIYDH